MGATFDCLIAPAQLLTTTQKANCWALYETITTDLSQRGVNRQYVDVEMFVMADGSCQSMEVNLRCFANQLMIFPLVFGPEGCCVSNSIDILRGEQPPAVPELPTGRVGVTAYVPSISGAPLYIESKTYDAIYYCGAQHAHVYAVSNQGQEHARRQCDRFYAQLSSQYTQDTAPMQEA